MIHQKPHKWNPAKDAQCCVQCSVYFKRGDDVLSDVALTIHEKCREAYRRWVKKEFGREPHEV